MKILALEFSSSQRSVAVADGAAHVREVIETGRANTMQPFAMTEVALSEAGLARNDIDCLVVGIGPGSYTGIRAAIAVAQGWQLARDVKVLGISSAEAIAGQAHADGLHGRVNVVIDAQRGEFYLATWELEADSRREVEPLGIVQRDVLEARARAGEHLVGPEVMKWFVGGRLVSPRAARLARLAAERTDFIRAEELEPVYLRATAFIKAPPARAV
jgi:tRNA threonylcarbamoyl adenosine modification protein YeaZ